MENKKKDEALNLHLEQIKLLKNIKLILPKLTTILEQINSENIYEEAMFQFYDKNEALLDLNNITTQMINILSNINPNPNFNLEFHENYNEILCDCVDSNYALKKNQISWSEWTRPFIETFMHTKFLVEILTLCGNKLIVVPSKSPPECWKLVLNFYQLR